MSSLPETENQALLHDTDTFTLPTDESLEWHYGHLSPDELLALDIPDRQKTRITQLQIAALYIVSLASDNELRDWINCYHAASGQSSDDSTYL